LGWAQDDWRRALASERELKTVLEKFQKKNKKWLQLITRR